MASIKQRPQRLGPGPPRRSLIDLPARTPQHRPTVGRHVAGEPREKRGLADSGFTGDQDEPRPAGAGNVSCCRRCLGRDGLIGG